MKVMSIWCLTVLASCMSVREVRAQASAGPALARIENGQVVVRQMMVPFVPLPGQERPGTPLVEPAEFQLRFNLAAIQVFNPSGKPTSSLEWHDRLKKETAVLFAGYAISESITPAVQDRLKLPASYEATYRPDALVLQGMQNPVQQTRVKGLPADFPKGPGPRLGQIWIGQDGYLHAMEQQESKSHFYAQYPTSPGAAAPARSHVYQTTTITVTRMLPVAEARVTDLEGKAVQAATVPELQGKWTPAVISADGGPVDPFFLKLIRPGTHVVTVPIAILPPGFNGPPKAPPPAGPRQ